MSFFVRLAQFVCAIKQRHINKDREVIGSDNRSTACFARLLADYAYFLINLYSVNVTSLAAPVNVYRLGSDYALYEVAWDGVDTLGGRSSSPVQVPNQVRLTGLRRWWRAQWRSQDAMERNSDRVQSRWSYRRHFMATF